MKPLTKYQRRQARRSQRRVPARGMRDRRGNKVREAREFMRAMAEIRIAGKK